jgi:hypothetical protein
MNQPTHSPVWVKPIEARSTAAQIIADHRARIAVEDTARAEKRRMQLADQASDLHSAGERIRVWEKIHGLRLPSDPSHPILDVVAVATRLTLGDVQEEQRSRATSSRAVRSNTEHNDFLRPD